MKREINTKLSLYKKRLTAWLLHIYYITLIFVIIKKGTILEIEVIIFACQGPKQNIGKIVLYTVPENYGIAYLKKPDLQQT